MRCGCWQKGGNVVAGYGLQCSAEDRVSACAEAKPVVTVIPGSVEQRGLVFRTSHGDPPFCRYTYCLARALSHTT